MPTRPHIRKMSAQRRFIKRSIFAVALLQPLGTIPQIIAIFSHRNAAGISISAWVLFAVFDAMWFWYGLDEKQWAVMVSAALFGLLDGIVVIGAFLYGGTL